MLRFLAQSSGAFALVVLLVVGHRRAPSLRLPAVAVAISVAADAVLALVPTDGRLGYHVAQGAWLAALFAVVALVLPGYAAAAWCAFVAVAVARYGEPSAPLYAVAQGAALCGLAWGVFARLRRVEIPLHGDHARVVLAVGELVALVSPLAQALDAGAPVSEYWDGARLVRIATMAGLCVVGSRAWFQLSPLSSGSVLPSRSLDGQTPEPAFGESKPDKSKN